MIPLLASMTSYVLRNKDHAGNARKVKLQAFTTFLNYCEEKSNGVRVTKELRRAIEAKNKGQLEKYLNI
jgi:hypothetical protein